MTFPEKIVPALLLVLSLAACATSPTNRLSEKLRNGSITVQDAESAVAGGADIRGSALLEQAAFARRADLVKFFVENGANVWSSPSSRSRGKKFSLFTYTTEEWHSVEIFDLCLAHYSEAPAAARAQMVAFADRQREAFVAAMYSSPKRADSYGALLEKIAESGVFNARDSREYSPREIRTAALKSVILAPADDDYFRKIDILLTSGANPNAPTSDGHSLLYIARENGWKNTVAVLEKAGAQLTAEEQAEADAILAAAEQEALEAAKKAEESAKRAEEARTAEEARKAEEALKVEEARAAEEARKAAEEQESAGTRSTRIRRGKTRSLGE